MQHLLLYESFVQEGIRASEAHRDQSAVATVVDGKRDLGFIALKTTTMNVEDFWQAVENAGLLTIPVEGNPYDAYVYYRPEAQAQAMELKSIAQKYGGFLRWDASQEDSIRIGELLGYAQEDIDSYIKANY